MAPPHRESEMTEKKNLLVRSGAHRLAAAQVVLGIVNKPAVKKLQGRPLPALVDDARDMTLDWFLAEAVLKRLLCIREVN
jgi:hypothetical protein